MVKRGEENDRLKKFFDGEVGVERWKGESRAVTLVVIQY